LVLKRFIIGSLVALWAAAGVAQSPEMLGAVRAELSDLLLELQELRAELTEPNPNGVEAPLGSETIDTSSFIERLDALEFEVRNLTGQIERQGFETNQRLTAAEARLANLAEVLNEKDGQGPLVITQPETNPFSDRTPRGTQLTAQEKADFERIEASFENAEYEEAIRRSDIFIPTYPGGPLTLDIMLRKAQSYEQLELWELAAQSYLDLFNESGSDDIGSRALMGLGASFEKLEKPEDACRSYLQVGILYPSSASVVPADQAQKALNCPS